jgi:hypothetical protein
MGVELLLGSGGNLDPGDGEMARAELPGVHEDPGPELVPLF